MERETRTLQELADDDNLRRLRTLESRGTSVYWNGSEYYNLSSNDYLGLSDPGLQQEFMGSLDLVRFTMSNPSSRLITGNSPDYDELEELLASLYSKSAGVPRTALVLGSGYAANSGLLPAVTQPGDLILADRLVHASLIDGLRLSGAEWQRFRHNDMNHLESLLQKAQGKYDRILVITESLFSMDGDTAPFSELAQLQERFGFRLYLDEAHAFAVYGHRESGLGLLDAYNRADTTGQPLQADYLVVTFGKGLASCGAAVICSPLTREYLVNRMRPLIFSTALPPISLMWSRFLIQKLHGFGDRRARLRKLIGILNKELTPLIPFTTQIVPIPAGSNERALEMAEELRGKGFWTTAIRYPTVPRSEARLRISLSGGHDPEKIRTFAGLCREMLRNSPL